MCCKVRVQNLSNSALGLRTLHDFVGSGHLLPRERRQPQRQVAICAVARPGANTRVGAAAVMPTADDSAASRGLLMGALTLTTTPISIFTRSSVAVQVGHHTSRTCSYSVSFTTLLMPAAGSAPHYRAVGCRFRGAVYLSARAQRTRHLGQCPQVVCQGDNAGAGLVAWAAELHLWQPTGAFHNRRCLQH